MTPAVIAISVARRFLCLILGFCVFTCLVPAQAPVTVMVTTTSPGIAIPNDFAGLSFETASIFTEAPARIPS